MDNVKEQESVIKSGLYSPRQLFITAIIGGPAISGFIIACNLWARNKKALAIIPVLPGLILSVAILFSIESVFHFITSHYPHFITSIVLRHIAAFALYFLLLAGFAVIIRYILKKNKKMETCIFPDINTTTFHLRKTYPIIIISFIYLLTISTFNIYLFAVLGFYLFTHFYGYILIHKAFGNTKIAKPFLVSLIILACLLPFIDTTGQILSVYGNLKLISFTYLNLIVGYYAIFILYMFIFILGINVILFMNRLIGIVPLKMLLNKTLLLITILLIIIAGASLMVIGTFINNNPVINRYSISLPKKASGLNSLKIISVSDLHLKNLTSTGFLKKLSDKIRLEKPDIIFLPGDIVETYGNTSKEKLNEFITILKDIKADYGIYAVRGNHDLPGVNVADQIDFNNRWGITMLADTLIELDDKINIIGLKYRGNNEKRPIDSLLGVKKKDLPVILMDHAPYCLEEAYKNKIDVQLSGHTHYGQIWPLNYFTDAVYDIAWGYKKIDSTNIFVSCGLQDAILPGRQDLSIPVRIGSVSEIIEINIEFR
jgi:predicted MPP superfamily phosphohydrolase